MYLFKIFLSLLFTFIFLGLKNFLLFEDNFILKFIDKDIFQSILDFIYSFSIVSLAFTVIYLVNFIVFEKLVKKQMKVEIPKFLIQSLDVLIFMFFLIMILHSIYKVPLTALLTITSVVGLGVAYGMRDIISDIFAGIALSIEKPFKIGDSILLEDGTVGEVYDVTWKSTFLKTTMKTIKTIPNGKIASTTIQNLNRNGNYYAIRKNFILPYDVPISKIKRIIYSTLEKRYHNDRDYNKEKFNLNVNICELTLDGIEYQIQFYCRDIYSERAIITEVLSSVVNELQKNNLRPSYKNINILNTNASNNYINLTKIEFFRNIDLFSSLKDDCLEVLTNNVFEKQYMQGEKIINEGEKGNSLFILCEGLLKVEVFNEELNQDIFLGFINSCEYFGEFSLLTNKPRSATVTCVTDCIVYEIKQEDIASVLESNRHFVGHLTDILSKREISNKEKLNNSKKISLEEKAELKKDLVTKIKTLFGI